MSYYFDTCFNYIGVKNFIRPIAHCLIKKIVTLVYCVVLIKNFSLHLVDFLSNNLPPPQTNVLRNWIMLIRTRRAVDQTEYHFCCWSWMKTDILQRITTTGEQAIRWYFTHHFHLRISFRNLIYGDRGSTVVKVLCYKSEGRWFDPRWCHGNSSLK